MAARWRAAGCGVAGGRMSNTRRLGGDAPSMAWLRLPGEPWIVDSSSSADARNVRGARCAPGVGRA
eukprot:2642592-Prymnesium_polylepis.1